MARDMHYADQFDAPVARGTGYDSDVASFSCDDHAEVCEQECHRRESQDV